MQQILSLLRRSALALLIALWFAPAAQAQTATTMSEPDVKAVERIIRQYLRDNPEVVVEAFRAYEAKRKALEERRKIAVIASRSDELRADPNSHIEGAADADVTVVEFFDYRCGYCKKVFPAVTALLEKDAKVRVLYKEFPILGPDSVLAARAAIAALEQPGYYMAFHDALMQTRGKLSQPVVLQIAAEVGLDVDQLTVDMRKPKVDKIIQANNALAKTLGINGTPAFIIGDRLVPGAISYEQLVSLVAEARNGCTTC